MKKKPVKKTAHENVPLVTKVDAGKRTGLIFSLILFFAAFILYANTIGHDYALDDVAVIHGNKFTKQGFAGIDDMLTTFYWQGYWDTNAGLYRPLSLITFAIEWQLFPNKPFVGHFNNVLLYAFTALLLFGLMRRLLKNYSLAVPFVCTLLFIAHPVHTEVVANIKSRDEILCFLFFIVSARLLFSYIDTGKKNKLMLSAVAYFFCVFSKEGGLAFLAVFPLLVYFFTEENIKQGIKRSVVFLIPAAIFMLLHWYAISHAPTAKITYTYLDNSLVKVAQEHGYIGRLATAIHIAGDYLKLLVFPHPLSYDYSFNQVPVSTFGNIQVIVTLLIIAALLYFAVKKLKEKNIYAFSILFYVITIVMVSNIIILIGATKADRFLYVPSLAFCLVIAIAGYKYLGQKGVITLAVIVFLAYGFKTVTRNADWKNDFVLFTKDVKASPGSSRTHYNYGTMYMDRVAMKEADPERKKEQLAIAIRELEEAIRIDNNAYDAMHNLGICYYHSKKYPESIQASLRSSQINPNDASTFSNLGNAYFRNNEYDKAIEALNKSIRMGYIADDTYNFLGSCYFSKQDFKTAIEYYNRALEKNPKQEDVLNNLASAYGSMNEFGKAIDTFKKAQEINPNNASTYYFIGLTYQRGGDLANAGAYFNKAKEKGMKF